MIFFVRSKSYFRIKLPGHMRLTYLTLLALAFSGHVFSQGSVKGKIIDSTSKQPLGLATLTVFKAADTAIITYRLSTPDGDFKVPGVPLDINCRLVVSFSGYRVYRKEFTLTSAQPMLDLGTISLPSDSKSLDEVLVIAERPPVTVRRDTIEFNTSAFKTIPNALLEDLLKKLPGVQVDAEGNIVVNGKPVNRILVDGKTFFGSDPKMATRNLPANIIDKVQVTDDKEELLRNGDDNLNNVGKVVNITLKKGVKKGWFGKAYAGGGTNNVYEGGVLANIFRDTLQVSILGYTNSLNKPGFSYSDLMQTAGLDRSSSNTGNRSTSIWSGPAGSGLSINGINFGGIQNYGGVASSNGGGFNLNHAPNTKNSFFLQYFNGNVNIDRITRTNIKQYKGDTLIENNTVLTGDVATRSHNIGAGAKLKPDSVTTIMVSANYRVGYQDEDRFSDIGSWHNKFDSLSRGNIIQDNIAWTYGFTENFSLTRLSKTKKGRRYSITQVLYINNRSNEYTTDSHTQFLYPTAYDSLLQQLRNERVPSTDGEINFNYSEPLSRILTLRVGTRYGYSHLSNDISTFNPGTIGGKYDVLNPLMSSRFERESHRGFITAGFEFKWKNLTITPSVRQLYQTVDNNLVSKSARIKQQLHKLLPGLGIVYKQLNINYGKDFSLPSYIYLLPVNDNTNPYFVARGNPNLVPAERHNLSVNYNFNNPKTLLNIWLGANGGLADNDVIQSTTVNDKGIQTTLPVNANGTQNASANYNINKQYKYNQKFTLSWSLGAWYSYNRNRLLFNGESSWQSTYQLNQWLGLNLNFNDKVEWNNNVSVGKNFTHYTSSVFKKLETVFLYYQSELIVRMPKHVIWETSFTYNRNSNVPTGTPKDIIRWHGALNFTMLKGEKGILRLAVNDILNTNKNINSSANRNMITTTQTNVLPQYFMATFTYNILAMGGAKKKVGGERMFLF
jgi:hypothetical protein